jgi:hypothetical protein
VQRRVLPNVKVCLRSSSLVFFLITLLLGLPVHRRDDRSIEPPCHTTHHHSNRLSVRRLTLLRLPVVVTIFLVLLYALALPCQERIGDRGLYSSCPSGAAIARVLLIAESIVSPIWMQWRCVPICHSCKLLMARSQHARLKCRKDKPCRST